MVEEDDALFIVLTKSVILTKSDVIQNDDKDQITGIIGPNMTESVDTDLPRLPKNPHEPTMHECLHTDD